jgi:hypothetical protein
MSQRVPVWGLVAPIMACRGPDTQPQPSVPDAIAAVSGAGQSGQVDVPLPEALAVQVTDAEERAVPGVQVQWSGPGRR